MSRILYFTCWYHEKYPERRAELNACIQKIVESKDIDHLYLVTEPPAEMPMKSEKITMVPTKCDPNCRPRYREMFEVANRYAEVGDVIVIANTDIFPDEGVRKFLQTIKQNECYALSRWDIQSNGSSVHFARKDSQDVWVFRAKLAAIQGGEFTMGTAGCDNRIAFDIKQSGYTVTNPSRSIKFHHLHLTNIRHYNPSRPIPSPYHLIDPSFLPQNVTA